MKSSIRTILAISFVASIMGSTMASLTPSLGVAESFGILSSTYTNTVATTINGDVAYTTAPPVTPTINGMVFMPAPAQAGVDQGVALANLNSQGCDVNFAAGAIDLASDTTHGTMVSMNLRCIV